MKTESLDLSWRPWPCRVAVVGGARVVVRRPWWRVGRDPLVVVDDPLLRELLHAANETAQRR